jgi:hypothetical protein
VLAGLGLALLLAGRVLPVAIVAIVFSGIALLIVGGSWVIMNEVKDDSGGGVSFGVGLPIGIAGTVLALAGSIMATAKRRRWPAAVV